VSSHGFFASLRLCVNSDDADAAPDGAWKLFGAGFYKDAAPTALGEGGLVASACHAEVGRRRKRSAGGNRRALKLFALGESSGF
jgi:hypothetical protein